MKTTVTALGQTVIPAKIRKEHQIGISTKLEWIDDGDTIYESCLYRQTLLKRPKGSQKDCIESS